MNVRAFTCPTVSPSSRYDQGSRLAEGAGHGRGVIAVFLLHLSAQPRYVPGRRRLDVERVAALPHQPAGPVRPLRMEAGQHRPRVAGAEANPGRLAALEHGWLRPVLRAPDLRVGLRPVVDGGWRLSADHYGRRASDAPDSRRLGTAAEDPGAAVSGLCGNGGWRASSAAGADPAEQRLRADFRPSGSDFRLFLSSGQPQDHAALR